MRRLVVKYQDVMAVNDWLKRIQPRSNSWLICSGTNHTTSKCILPTQQKNGKILKAGRCTKCLHKGNLNKDCGAEPFRRSRGRYHTFLCYRASIDRESANKETDQEKQHTMAFSSIKSATKPTFVKLS